MDAEGIAAPIATFTEAYKLHNEFSNYKYIILLSLGINASYGGVILENIKYKKKTET